MPVYNPLRLIARKNDSRRFSNWIQERVRLVPGPEPKSFQFHVGNPSAWHGAKQRGAMVPYMIWLFEHTTMKPVIYFSHAKAYAFLGTLGIGRGVLAAP